MTDFPDLGPNGDWLTITIPIYIDPPPSAEDVAEKAYRTALRKMQERFQ